MRTHDDFPVLSHKAHTAPDIVRGLLQVGRAALSSELSDAAATREGLIYLLDVVEDLLPDDAPAGWPISDSAFEDRLAATLSKLAFKPE